MKDKKSAPAMLEIKNCQDCPFLDQKRHYTDDSWEQAYNWYCKKKNGKKIQGYVEWYDNVEIPEWCPLKAKNEKSKK